MAENHDGFSVPFEGPGVLPGNRPLRRRTACLYCDLGFRPAAGAHVFPKHSRPCANAAPEAAGTPVPAALDKDSTSR